VKFSAATRTRTRTRTRLHLVLLLGACALALPILAYPPGRDQGWFAVFGRGILDGYKPYLDFWDTKPPAIFYTYATAFALLGKTAIAIRALDFIFIVPCALFVWAIGRRLGETQGLMAALAFVAFYFTETFWTLSQADGLAVLPLTASAYCLTLAVERELHPRWLMLSGMAAGCAIWYKYSLALVVLALLLAMWLWIGFQQGRSLIRATAFYGLGIAVVAVIGVAFLALNGILPATLESLQVARRYATQDYADGRWLQSTVWIAGVNERIARWWPLLVLCALWWPLRILRQNALDIGMHRLLWLWLLAGFANVLVQAKGFDYHWLPALPPMVILAMNALPPLVRATRLSVAGIVAALLILLLVTVTLPTLPYLLGGQPRTEFLSRFTAGEFSARESAEITEFLRQRVAPGDTLFVWGSRPEVYFQSQLRPATRFVSHTQLSATWTPSNWRKENVDVLWAAMPPYALVLQADYFPWVTGNSDDSNTLLQGYTELNNWLIANYERDGQIGNFLIWKRKR
jgi:4-amino-4-deoxy-L-arabinose transferase-like glycosyltransferase